jgi:5-methylcytosine-specific restriction endonuclease McrA
MISLPVLVLNQSYEPLNICRTRRALMLIYRGKAEMLEDGTGFAHSVSETFPLPSVIRLAYLIHRPRPRPRLSRLEIFKRDHYTCQYCGRATRQLTLDHIIPRHQNGQHSWNNLVSACIPCNCRKAGQTPEQAGMKLRRQPTAPPTTSYCYLPYERHQIRKEWQKYLPPFQSS